MSSSFLETIADVPLSCNFGIGVVGIRTSFEAVLGNVFIGNLDIDESGIGAAVDFDGKVTSLLFVKNEVGIGILDLGSCLVFVSNSNNLGDSDFN